jgi:hypothetical protein
MGSCSGRMPKIKKSLKRSAYFQWIEDTYIKNSGASVRAFYQNYVGLENSFPQGLLRFFKPIK